MALPCVEVSPRMAAPQPTYPSTGEVMKGSSGSIWAVRQQGDSYLLLAHPETAACREPPPFRRSFPLSLRQRSAREPGRTDHRINRAVDRERHLLCRYAGGRIRSDQSAQRQRRRLWKFIDVWSRRSPRPQRHCREHHALCEGDHAAPARAQSRAPESSRSRVAGPKRISGERHDAEIS
jgi:hypothetical protein